MIGGQCGTAVQVSQSAAPPYPERPARREDRTHEGPMGAPLPWLTQSPLSDPTQAQYSHSSDRGHGIGLWPHSPAIACGPASTRPPTTMPPPVPVPTITPNTQVAPAAAPSLASESAKQLASLASRTGRPSICSRSSASERPFSHTEFAFVTSPVAGEIAPGLPTPTMPSAPRSASTASTIP
jgi:hypothetical protein